MAVISRLVASGGSTANFDFTSIPGTYENLVLEISGRGDLAANTFVRVRVQFNADTGSNYDSTSGFINSSGASIGDAVAAASGRAGAIPAATAPANKAGHVTITIPAYARTTFHKDYSSTGGLEIAASGGNLECNIGSGTWANTAAITEVKVFPESGNFVDGTVATLYGVAGS